MASASFAKWYVAKLKAQPLLVNLSSGFLLMSTGDVLAQRVEIRANKPRQQSLEQQSTSSTTTLEDMLSSPAAMFLQATDAAYRTFQEEIESFGWDKSRTAKMAAWSVLFTPFYVGIFKMYDRYLPKKNLPSVAARVGFSFLSSIPINFAFYSYGNFVQHTADWYEERQQQRELRLEAARLQQRSIVQRQTDVVDVNVPYRFDKLVEKTQRKLEAEFVTTIKTSASFWIPLNFLSFWVVPSHLQPVNLMFFSVFWNCYLSMSQHRAVDPDGESADDETNH